jgi:hypothetical protein
MKYNGNIRAAKPRTSKRKPPELIQRLLKKIEFSDGSPE